MIAAAAATALAPAISQGQAAPGMKHVVLLGDSVFDNGGYVGGGPDVVTPLRERLPSGWRASLAAVDGGVIAELARQLERMPGDPSHLAISVGGNDALRYSGLTVPSRSVADPLEQLAATTPTLPTRSSPPLRAARRSPARSPHW